ncbi:MAG: hypothetical protein AB9835_11715 [Eubacteriales bacterium]
MRLLLNKKTQWVMFIIILVLLYVIMTQTRDLYYKNVQISGYNLSLPRKWKALETDGKALCFMSGGKEIGGLDVMSYYPGQPLSQLVPNHSQIIESRRLNGYFTEAVFFRLINTPPAASGSTTEVEQLHLFFIMSQKQMAYDLYFYTMDVEEQTALDIAKSFMLE